MNQYWDNAPCIFWVMSGHGQLMAANQTFCTLLGLERNVVLQKNISQLITLATRIFFQTHLFPMMQVEGRANEVFITLRSADTTEVPVIVNFTKGADGELVGAGISIYNRNRYEEEIIAAKKYAEKALTENIELLQTKARLQQHAAELDEQLLLLQQQNGNLNQINWTLTHTLQEPLRKISLFISKLQAESPPAGKSQPLDKINNLALHTRQLLTHLQRYVQIGLDDTTPRPVDLQPLVQAAAAAIAAEGNLVTVALPPLCFVEGYDTELKLLLHELLQNAAQAKKAGAPARITIEGTVVQANSFRLLKEKYQYNNYLRLAVSDEGIGFQPYLREQIFGLFAKLNPQSAGFGVGLALCKKIMELHKGFINADAGKDSTVINCYFPLTEAVV